MMVLGVINARLFILLFSGMKNMEKKNQKKV